MHMKMKHQPRWAFALLPLSSSHDSGDQQHWWPATTGSCYGVMACMGLWSFYIIISLKQNIFLPVNDLQQDLMRFPECVVTYIPVICYRAGL